MHLKAKVAINGVARIAAVGFALIVALDGCGAEFGGGVGGPGGNDPPDIQFSGWTGPASSSCTGRLQNGGETARNIRVEVWYADAESESVRVVRPTSVDLPTYGTGYFTVPGQITNGEFRYPRMGTISWDGGSRPAEPRKSEMVAYNVCRFRADSLIVWFSNNAWAYHGSVTYEDRGGIHTLPILPDPLPGGWGLYCLPRDSSGVQLPPRILKLRWEDYGGVPDSVIDAPTDTIGC